MANHLGHEVNIHENIYRIHDSVIELAKVSRLLMAVDEGKLSKFCGKSLQEIHTEGMQLFLQMCLMFVFL